jgi:hypothetical protein
MNIDGGYPVYVLDNDEVLFVHADCGHDEYWQNHVSSVVADRFGVERSQIINMPYCQRRGRIVGNILYCGERLPKKLVSKISKAVGYRLKQVFDDHEIRCEISHATFRGLIGGIVNE